MFPKGRHSAVNEIEKMVGKMNGLLKSTGVFNKLKTGQYSISAAETIILATVSSMNTRPLCIVEGQFITPMSWGEAAGEMSISNDALGLKLCKTAKSDTDIMLEKEKINKEEPNQLKELKAYNKALGELGANVEHLYMK